MLNVLFPNPQWTHSQFLQLNCGITVCNNALRSCTHDLDVFGILNLLHVGLKLSPSTLQARKLKLLYMQKGQKKRPTWDSNPESSANMNACERREPPETDALTIRPVGRWAISLLSWSQQLGLRLRVHRSALASGMTIPSPQNDRIHMVTRNRTCCFPYRAMAVMPFGRWMGGTWFREWVSGRSK